MVSVERVLGYGKLESEASLETIPPQLKPSEEWPTHGCIQLRDLVYKYSTNSQDVLKGISCCIEPTEKVSKLIHRLTYTMIIYLDWYSRSYWSRKVFFNISII